MKIRWRLTLFNALGIGAILLVLGFSLYFLLREALISDLQATVESRAEAAANEIEDWEDVEELASGEDAEELTFDGVFIVVRDEEGNILAQTTDLVGGEAVSDSVWRRTAESGETASGTANLSEEAPDFVSAAPVELRDGPSLVVEVGKSYEDVNETLAVFETVLVAGIGIAFLLAIVGAYLLARAALSPVDAVVDAAREMTYDDLSKRLPVAHPKDEIGRLATTINGLLARLEAAFIRQEETLIRQRRFVADASHELRTPLASVDGYARMLEQWGLEDPEKAKESVAAIRRESERMRELIEHLLSLARGDEGPPMKPEPGDLAIIAEDAAETVRATAEGRVAVEYVPSESPIHATFDHSRVREAVSILLDNAVKYTPEGGRVTVTAFEKDGRSAVEVADTGIGIPEDHLPLIFERFHRADEARGATGAGLGLSIARQIAEAHGGRIEAKSAPGEGSTFTLLLPKKRSL